MPKIKAVLFDLDDTLFDCCGLLVEAARRRAARAMVDAGLPCTEEEAYEAQVRLAEERGPRFNVFDAIAHAHGMSSELSEVALAAYNSEEVGDIEPFPDVPPTLERLRAQGYRLLLCTVGVTARQHKKIEALRIAPYFDEIVINDVETGEHRDECFLELISRHGLKPEEVLCVGDRVQADARNGTIVLTVTRATRA